MSALWACGRHASSACSICIKHVHPEGNVSSGGARARATTTRPCSRSSIRSSIERSDLTIMTLQRCLHEQHTPHFPQTFPASFGTTSYRSHGSDHDYTSTKTTTTTERTTTTTSATTTTTRRATTQEKHEQEQQRYPVTHRCRSLTKTKTRLLEGRHGRRPPAPERLPDGLLPARRS